MAVALLLPLLAMRALLPADYMLAVASGELRIVMCQPGLASWSDAATGMAHQHGKQLPDHADECPFAHAVANAPPPHIVRGHVSAAPAAGFRAIRSDHQPPATGPPRQHGARAPPVSSHNWFA
jgi:hypothetical protein